MRATRARRRPGIGGIALTLAVLAGTVTTGALDRAPVAAQADAAPLDLVAQTTWTAVGDTFQATVRPRRFDVDQIAVTVHRPVGSRFEFLASTQGVIGAEVLEAYDPVPLESVIDTTGVALVEIPTRAEDGDADPEAPIASVPVPRTGGVHPVVIDALVEGEVVESVTTHLVVEPEPEPGTHPLAVSVTASVDAPVALQPDQTFAIDPDAVDRLERLAAQFAAVERLPVAFDVTPELVAALARSGVDRHRRVLTDLAAEADHLDYAPRAFVDLHPGAWSEAGLDDALTTQIDLGTRTLEDELDARIDSGTRVLDHPLDGDLIAWLEHRGVERLVVPADAIEALSPDRFPLTLTQSFLLDADGVRLAATTPDPLLQAHLMDDDAVLAAHHALADLAVLAFDQPAVPRGVVLELTTEIDDDTLALLLDGLGDGALVAPVSLDRWFELVEPAEVPTLSGTPTTLVRELLVDEVPPVADYAPDLAFATGAIAAASDLVGGEPSIITPLEELLVVTGDESLDDEARAPYFTTIYESISTNVDQITADAAGTVTITARDAAVPVTIENGLTVTANVSLILEGDKLEFPDGARLDVALPPAGRTEIDIPIRARSSGDSVLRVTVRSQDTSLYMDEVQIIVRSTAISGLGLAISVVALLVLALWWGREILRGRRRRHAHATDDTPTDDTTTDDSTAKGTDADAARDRPGRSSVNRPAVS